MIKTNLSHTSIDGDANKLVGGDDNSKVIQIVLPKESKLASLFKKLKEQFEEGDTIDTICDNLKRYTDRRDTIGLEQKLIDGDRAYLYDDAKWFKQEYSKKLTKYQFFEPAQEIFSFIMGVVCEKFTNIIYPLLREAQSDAVIQQTISNEIINPIMTLIQEEGCNDIMGLSASDINGMVYFLTGRCHLRWKV